jgi:hypothetical protein
MIMRNKIILFSILGLLTLSCSLIMPGCKKPGLTTPNQEVAGFAKSSDSYLITDNPNSVYKIPVGITAIPNADRKVTFTVSSPSGAVSGQQYILGSTTVTIPAGKTVDSIAIKGLFSGYTGNRKDTLIFKITGGDVKPMVGSDKFTLYLQKVCPLNMSDFAGNFEVLEDWWQDYFPGDVVSLTVNGNTILFDYPTAYNHQSLPIVVNPTTLATSVVSTAFGRYSASGTNYTAKSVPGANSVVVPCDKIISVELSFGSTGGANYGGGLLILRKL